MDIFSYADLDGDILRIGPAPEDWDDAHDGCLAFTVTQRGQDHSVALPPSVVDELIGALERWRSGVITARAALTPPADLNPIYDAIVKRLTDEWLPRVLPLHQTPQAAVPECSFGLHKGGCVCGPDPESQAAVRVTAPTADFPVTSCHRSGNHDRDTMCSDCVCDPEPHDVGHAEEPSDHGRLMSELQRAAVRSVACTCAHSWADHHTFGCWVTGCKCTRGRS